MTVSSEHLVNGPRVKRLESNKLGRDFVVGDIHGAYDLVLAAMKRVGFDRKVDRILSVGDLVDRGPESARCLKFLKCHYVHAVRGNHEENLLQIYAKGEPPEDVLNWFLNRFHMEWWKDVIPADRQEILEQFAALPVVMEVDSPRGLVGLVHGQVPRGMTWSNFLQRIELNDESVREQALEGRQRIQHQDHSGVQGVCRLFVGHTPQRGGPKRYGNVYAVDTGAIFNVMAEKNHYAMTFANVICRTELLTQKGAGNVEQIISVDDPGDGPFGQYAEQNPGLVGSS